MARSMGGRSSGSSEFDRMLDYRVKHSGWIMFKSFYWAIYLLVIGSLLVYNTFTLTTLAGLSLFILAIMIIVYGFSEVLHHKLMRKHA